MKFKNVVLFFSIATPINIILRVLQLCFTIDEKTGFFKPESENFGYYILIFLAFTCVATAIFALCSHRAPEQPPANNIFLGITSLLPVIALFFELFQKENLDITHNNFSKIIVVLGLFAVTFFLCFSLKNIINVKLYAFLYCLPCIYYIVKIVYEFSTISTLALISDIVLQILSYCFILIFFLQFAKLYNKAETDFDFRKLLCSGLLASLLCFTQSIPYLFVNYILNLNHTHTTLPSNITTLAMGIFISVFLFFHFRKENACV